MNEEKKLLAIREGKPSDPFSQKIYWEFIADGRQCCEFYSKLLVERMQNRILESGDEKTLRAFGRWDNSSRSIVFSLSDVKPLGEDFE